MDSSPVQEDSEGLAVVKVLAVVLERLVGANSHLSEGEKGQVTKFHALRAPVIGIGPYLERCVFELMLFVGMLICELTCHFLQNSQIRIMLQGVLHNGTHLH
jgi:hypothetical protein